MKNWLKKVLSLLTAIAMLISCTALALAEEDGIEPTSDEAPVVSDPVQEEPEQVDEPAQEPVEGIPETDNSSYIEEGSSGEPEVLDSQAPEVPEEPVEDSTQEDTSAAPEAGDVPSDNDNDASAQGGAAEGEGDGEASYYNGETPFADNSAADPAGTDASTADASDADIVSEGSADGSNTEASDADIVADGSADASGESASDAGEAVPADGAAGTDDPAAGDDAGTPSDDDSELTEIGDDENLVTFNDDGTFTDDEGTFSVEDLVSIDDPGNVDQERIDVLDLNMTSEKKFSDIPWLNLNDTVSASIDSETRAEYLIKWESDRAVVLSLRASSADIRMTISDAHAKFIQVEGTENNPGFEAYCELYIFAGAENDIILTSNSPVEFTLTVRDADEFMASLSERVAVEENAEAVVPDDDVVVPDEDIPAEDNTAADSGEDIDADENNTADNDIDENNDENNDADDSDEEGNDNSDDENDTDADTDDNDIPVITGWISVSAEAIEIGRTITLSAESDAYLGDMVAWQTKVQNSDNWVTFNYGKSVEVELTEENIHNSFRFRMEYDNYSDELTLNVSEEKVDEPEEVTDTDENEDKEDADNKDVEGTEDQKDIDNGEGVEDTENKEDSENDKDLAETEDKEDEENKADTDGSEDVEDSENKEDAENGEDLEKAEDKEDAENKVDAENSEDDVKAEDKEDSEKSEKVQDTENKEEAENSEGVVKAENKEDTENSEAEKEVKDTENSEAAVNAEGIEKAEGTEEGEVKEEAEPVEETAEEKAEKMIALGYTKVIVTAEEGSNLYAVADKESVVTGHLDAETEIWVLLNEDKTWGQLYVEDEKAETEESETEAAPAQFISMEDAKIAGAEEAAAEEKAELTEEEIKALKEKEMTEQGYRKVKVENTKGIDVFASTEEGAEAIEHIEPETELWIKDIELEGWAQLYTERKEEEIEAPTKFIKLVDLEKVLTDEEMLAMGCVKIRVIAEEGADLYAEASKESEVVGHLDKETMIWVIPNEEKTWGQIFTEDKEAGSQFISMEYAVIVEVENKAVEEKTLTNEEMLELGYVKAVVAVDEGADVYSKVDDEKPVSHLVTGDEIWVKKSLVEEFAEIYSTDTEKVTYTKWINLIVVLYNEKGEEENSFRSVKVSSSRDGLDFVEDGSLITMSAELINFLETDQVSFQWQYSDDGKETWKDAFDGKADTYSYFIGFDNYYYEWRLIVTITIPDVKTEEASENLTEAGTEKLTEGIVENSAEELSEDLHKDMPDNE